MMARKGTPRPGLVIDETHCPHIISRGKREGLQCTHVAGQGTRHQGAVGSYCTDHGGNNGPAKHNIYSQYSQTKLADKIEAATANPQTTDMKQVIAVQAALLGHHLDMNDTVSVFEVSKALIASIDKWHHNMFGEKVTIRIESIKIVIDACVTAANRYIPTQVDRLKFVKTLEQSLFMVAGESGGNGE